MLFNYIKTELNSSRPVIVNTQSHAMVAYWYNNITSVTKIIRVNLWWWEWLKITSDSGVVYYGSNIDYYMDAIYYDWASQWGIKSIFNINLKK